MSISVFIADDHPIFRRGLCEIIGEEGDLHLVGQASAGDDALEQVLALRPDVAVLDVEMPGMSGIEAARALDAKGVRTRVILLTMYEDEALCHEAIERGVRGYVLKENAVDEVVTAIREVASGRAFFSPSLIDSLVRRKRAQADLRKSKPGLEQLTPAERRILKQIAEDKTSKEIAEALSISVRTVETHRQNISTKLGLSGSHSLLKFAFHNKARL